MTTTTPEALETNNGGLLNAYKSKEEVEKLYLDSNSVDKKTIEKLPQPTGWRLLVLPYSGPKKTKGGIVYSDVTHERIQMTTVCGLVLKMGPLCYKDKEKFNSNPWCKEGDWIIFGRYAGSRFKIEGGEVRILNDDEIIATISNPEDILHAY
jgi:co-chaperonin GroES (HSP10)